MSVFQLPVTIHTRMMTSQGVTIYYPHVTWLANRSVQEQINQVISNLVRSLQQEQMKYQTGTNMEMTGHYEIKTNERGILSLTLSNYAYSSPMAHGFTIVKSLTFDINTAKVYALHDLFKPSSNYVGILSKLVSQQITQREIPLLDGFQAIQPNQDYYLADKSLVLYFQLYEITPYYVGFPMFPISVYDVQSISTEQGPINTLSVDIS
jgi:hypothetical protein